MGSMKRETAGQWLQRDPREDGLDLVLEGCSDQDVEALYDPHEPPDPQEWLALDEGERIERVRCSHEDESLSDEQLSVHAALHAAVETQIAMGDETPVRKVVERLMDGGLDRHDAIHAVSCVLLSVMNDAVKAGGPENSPPLGTVYFAELERLTAVSWHRDFGKAE